jgi:hypothetical protein
VVSFQHEISEAKRMGCTNHIWWAVREWWAGY